MGGGVCTIESSRQITTKIPRPEATIISKLPILPRLQASPMPNTLGGISLQIAQSVATPGGKIRAQLCHRRPIFCAPRITFTNASESLADGLARAQNNRGGSAYAHASEVEGSLLDSGVPYTHTVHPLGLYGAGSRFGRYIYARPTESLRW